MLLTMLQESASFTTAYQAVKNFRHSVTYLLDPLDQKLVIQYYEKMYLHWLHKFFLFNNTIQFTVYLTVCHKMLLKNKQERHKISEVESISNYC